MKRNRKIQRGLAGESTEADAADGEAPPLPEGAPTTQAAVLAALAALHDSFENEKLDFDEFEAAKAELIGRLHVD